MCRLFTVSWLLLLSGAAWSATLESQEQPLPTATSIIEASIDHWRGLSSYNEMTMTIMRPDWQRTMSMRGWTEGQEFSLVRVTAPKKDSGNGTLLRGNSMWLYSPKINRVVKVPSSMMGQSWMGSDFSNKDVARSDDIVTLYQHTLLATDHREGRDVYTIEAIPHEDSPVVWGRELLIIRDDFVLLQHQFFDQDGVLVKTLETLAVAELGGRTVAQTQRMHKQGVEGEWTEISIQVAEFEVEIPANMFTLSNLRNPRQ